MTSPGASGHAAVSRARLLLAEPAAGSDDRGYIDLLGSAAPARTGVAQALMMTPVIPVIYERWWRPGFGRLLMGWSGPGMDGELRMAAEMLDLSPGRRVLDVACGPGNFTRDFGSRVAPDGLAVGIDASPTMLARAVADTRAGNVAYVRGDAVSLPFADRSFDAVCCFAALHMFAEPWRALGDMARVLVPGGRIALLTSSRSGGGPRRVLDTLGGRLSGQQMFERGEVVAALSERGFQAVSQQVSGLAQFVSGVRRAG